MVQIKVLTLGRGDLWKPKFGCQRPNRVKIVCTNDGQLVPTNPSESSEGAALATYRHGVQGQTGRGRNPEARARTSSHAFLTANRPLVPHPFRSGKTRAHRKASGGSCAAPYHGELAVGGTIHLFRKPQRSFFGKLLREFRLVAADRRVSTLDGVLEVRNEHFWTLGFGSLAGSVHVRIRRDANEQMVLAHVTNRLYTLVSTLTVQIFKDDWIRPALLSGPVAANVLNFSDHHVIPMPLLKGADDLNPVTSTPAKPSSPPPEFSFNTPGKNVNPVILLNTQTRPYGFGLNHGHTPYSNMLNQGLGVPGIGATQGLRTGFTNIPSRYGTNNRIGQPRP
ncbi:hypothetical protein H8959_013388 [Pygathrix nigripes]